MSKLSKKTDVRDYLYEEAFMQLSVSGVCCNAR
jgi:hypothetical protein